MLAAPSRRGAARFLSVGGSPTSRCPSPAPAPRPRSALPGGASGVYEHAPAPAPRVCARRGRPAPAVSGGVGRPGARPRRGTVLRAGQQVNVLVVLCPDFPVRRVAWATQDGHNGQRLPLPCPPQVSPQAPGNSRSRLAGRTDTARVAWRHRRAGKQRLPWSARHAASEPGPCAGPRPGHAPCRPLGRRRACRAPGLGDSCPAGWLRGLWGLNLCLTGSSVRWADGGRTRPSSSP